MKTTSIFLKSMSDKKQKNNKKQQMEFNEEFLKYVHTMKDDLNNIDPVKRAKESSKNKINFKVREKNNENKPSNSTSPFLTQNESDDSYFASQKNYLDKEKKAEPEFNTATFNQSQPKKEFSETQKSEKKKQVVKEKKSKGKGKKIMVSITAFMLIISLLGAGVFYYWESFPQFSFPKKGKVDKKTPQDDEGEIRVTPVFEKYSLENPNVLTVDIENSSEENLKNIFTSIAEEIQGVETISPFEFIITDKNNNPIAFPIFAIAANLNLSEEILRSLDEEFSFFVYSDQGNARLSISIKIRDGETLNSQLSIDENQLLSGMSFLFLDKNVTTSEAQFKDGSYKDITTRYINFNENNTLSLDYALYEDKLILSTSKNTMRAILELFMQKKITI